jgi:hypothetical protein
LIKRKKVANQLSKINLEAMSYFAQKYLSILGPMLTIFLDIFTGFYGLF